jgi:hypothetical protein
MSSRLIALPAMTDAVGRRSVPTGLAGGTTILSSWHPRLLLLWGLSLPSSSSSSSPLLLRCRYHPLLQDAQTFLERVHRCVEAPMFQTLSQDCVKSCCLSLLDAAEAVEAVVRDKHPLRVCVCGSRHWSRRQKIRETVQCASTSTHASLPAWL